MKYILFLSLALQGCSVAYINYNGNTAWRAAIGTDMNFSAIDVGDIHVRNGTLEQSKGIEQGVKGAIEGVIDSQTGGIPSIIPPLLQKVK